MSAIEGTGGDIISGDFKKQRARAAAASFIEDSGKQCPTDTGPALCGRYAESQDLALLAEPLRQRKPDRGVAVAGQQAKEPGNRGDIGDRLWRPWIVGEATTVKFRENLGECWNRGNRQRFEPYHRRAARCPVPARVTSGGRR